MRGASVGTFVRWVLVFVGFESILYFVIWWLDPVHPRNLEYFIPLTFAMFWLFHESSIYWFYLLNMRTPPEKSAPAGLRVDIFTTAAPGEPIEMFEQSLEALVAITYPHRTYLLDGTGDPAFQDLAGRLGADWIDCRGVGGAKAGKINHALGLTDGEIVLVIDPDHIAFPRILDRVLGHFDDPAIGFVQVVQAYHNQGVSFVARAAAEQTYGFYGPILMGMNGYGVPIVIGANCTFRRTALESINGHAVHLTEDLVTSIRLHAAGWDSVYVPEILARGLVPEDLTAYFGQQLKWSTGMFEVFFSVFPRAFTRLHGWRRFCYLLGTSYYFVGLAITINLILPIVFLFFGFWAVEMAFDDFVTHLLPFLVMFLVIHGIAQSSMRDPAERGLQWRGMLLKMGTWPIYLLGLIYTICRVAVPYLPTPKKRQKAGFPVLILPHVMIVILSGAAIFHALGSSLRNFGGTRLMIFFAILNMLLMLPTIAIAVAESLRGPEATR